MTFVCQAQYVLPGMAIDLEDYFAANFDTDALATEIDEFHDGNDTDTKELSVQAKAYSGVIDEYSQVESVSREDDGQRIIITTDHWTVVVAPDYRFEVDIPWNYNETEEEPYRTIRTTWKDVGHGELQPPEAEEKPNPKNQGAEKSNSAAYWKVELTAKGAEAMHHSDRFYVWHPTDRGKSDIYPGIDADGGLVFATEVGGEPKNYVPMTSRTDWNFDTLPKEWWIKAVPLDKVAGSVRDDVAVVTPRGVLPLAAEDEEIR